MEFNTYIINLAYQHNNKLTNELNLIYYAYGILLDNIQ